jgi:hypothetical protein
MIKAPFIMPGMPAVPAHGKSGTFYWVIGLMKIDNMGKWAETNEPMDADFTHLF